MNNIDEVFSELDARIDLLKQLPKSRYTSSLLKTDFNISRIERNIQMPRFKDDRVLRIDTALKELRVLKSMGISIINNSNYTDEYEFIGEADFAIPKIEELSDETREEYYRRATNEIDFYISGLTNLKSSLEMDADIKVTKIEFVIDSKFDFSKIKHDYNISPSLTQAQIVLLFQYLRKKEIILPLNQTSMSTILKLLTGFSDNTLKSAIRNIESFKRQEKTSEGIINDYQILQEALKSIIKDMDNVIAKIPAKK
ncbi:MAG: hypothetical protein ABIN01_13920 [Ferruginibacter sp.]